MKHFKPMDIMEIKKKLCTCFFSQLIQKKNIANHARSKHNKSPQKLIITTIQ